MRRDRDVDWNEVVDPGEHRDGGQATNRAAREERSTDRYGAEDDATEGMLCYGGARWPLSGRALRLMLWLAARQQGINAIASERGQLWITWKGNGPHSIDGEVKARLASE
jgi:hypothetical protein